MKKRFIAISIIFFIVTVFFVIYFIFRGNDNTKILINQKQYNLTGTTLNLDSVGIGDDEIKNISKKIEKSNDIKVLYLGGNHITEKGLLYLLNLDNNEFSTLDLSNNNIGGDFVGNFLKNIISKVIDLSGNNLDDLSFSGVLNSKIEYLTINDNNIGDDGFKNILKNKNLAYLSIENNNLTDESIDYLEYNYKDIGVKYLKLKGNDFSTIRIKKLDELKQFFITLEY